MNSTYIHISHSQTFHGYRISVRGLLVTEGGFDTEADAAWAADKARRLLSPFITKKRPYNFPDRVQHLSEHELSEVSPELMAFFTTLCTAFPSLIGDCITPTAVASPKVPAATESHAQIAERRAAISSLTRKRDCLRSAASALRDGYGPQPEGRLGTTLTLLHKLATSLSAEITVLASKLPRDVVGPLDTETT